MYVMAAVLITLALFCMLIPESEKSVYLPVAILNNDDNEKTDEIVEELCNMKSVFEFYEVGSEEEMLDDLAQGKANTGFVIPEVTILIGSSSFSPPVRMMRTSSTARIHPVTMINRFLFFLSITLCSDVDLSLHPE